MYAYFDRFTLNITLKDAQSASHAGRCDDDVAHLRTKPYIRRQLAKLDPQDLAYELHEYGAWDEDQLADHEANLDRILWIACGNISEEYKQRLAR